jgi:hypothetical protein
MPRTLAPGFRQTQLPIVRARSAVAQEKNAVFCDFFLEGGLFSQARP